MVTISINRTPLLEVDQKQHYHWTMWGTIMSGREGYDAVLAAYSELKRNELPPEAIIMFNGVTENIEFEKFCSMSKNSMMLNHRGFQLFRLEMSDGKNFIIAAYDRTQRRAKFGIGSTYNLSDFIPGCLRGSASFQDFNEEDVRDELQKTYSKYRVFD